MAAHGGFAAAGRALRAPKSTLSRRVAALEKRLGVRLIERSTRRFRVTEIGQAFYERCRIVVMDVEQADAIVSEALGEPRGIVRCACPLGLVEALTPAFVGFMRAFPKAKLQIVAVDRAVGLIDERIDVAIRVRTALDADAALTMRTLGRSSRILVAAPSLAAACAAVDVAALSDLPTLATTDQMGEIIWEFLGPDGEPRAIRHEPRMTSVDFVAVRDAAVAGLGVALLPDHTCRAELASGRLAHVFPQWRTEDGIIHLVFTTRRGLPPVVRAFIDHLAGAFRSGEALPLGVRTGVSRMARRNSANRHSTADFAARRSLSGVRGSSWAFHSWRRVRPRPSHRPGTYRRPSRSCRSPGGRRSEISWSWRSTRPPHWRGISPSPRPRSRTAGESRSP